MLAIFTYIFTSSFINNSPLPVGSIPSMFLSRVILFMDLLFSINFVYSYFPPRRFINSQSLTSTSGRFLLKTFWNNLLSIAIDAKLACSSPIIQTVLLFLSSIFFSTMSNVYTCHIISRFKHPFVFCNLFLRSRRTLSCSCCFFKIYYLEDFM